jgi:plastocyanin
MDRRTYLAATSSTLALGTAGCVGLLGDGSTAASAYDVGMSTVDFRPEVIEVTVGEPVVWKNTSSHAHTVTAYDSGIPEDADYFASGGFDSAAAARDGWRTETGGALYQGDSYEHTFAVPGEYQYFCIPHEQSNMVGTVVVTPESTATATTDGA